MPIYRRWWTSLVLVILDLNRLDASPGDYSPGYQRCVNLCNFERCFTADPDPYQLPFPLSFFGWTCPDDCSYQCMHDLTEKARKLPLAVPPPGQVFEGWWDEPDWTPGVELEGLPPGRIVQFHGKWPFKRWYGIQEPLSVIFSLLNLLGYVESYRRMKKIIPTDWPLRNLYLNVALVGSNAWVWSIIFHCRDKPWTERFDYFGAAAHNLYGLYVSAVRVFRLYDSKANHHIPLEARIHLASQLKLIFSALYLVHIAFLSSGERFNYKYNMFVNVLVGVLTILLWLTWTASHHYEFPDNEEPLSPNSESSSRSNQSEKDPEDLNELNKTDDQSSWLQTHLMRSEFMVRTLRSMSTTTTTGIQPPYTYRPIIPLVFLLGAGSLELLDFPPVLNMSLDAHALWHLATFPLGPVWCLGVLACDASWEAQFVENLES